MVFFDKGPGNSTNSFSTTPWIATYGNVQGTANLQSNVPVVDTYDNLVLFDLQRYVGGCTQFGNQPQFQTCTSQFGFGALELNLFTPYIYASDILTRVHVSGFGYNASGQLIGIGCSMDKLGVAQGLGIYVTPPQTGPNSCDTVESDESLAIGPRTVLTTPEPGTWISVAFGLGAIALAVRRRSSRSSLPTTE